MCVSIAFACYLTEIRANQVSRESYKMLEDLKLNNETRSDLVVLGTFSNSHYPNFTTTGFFSVSRSTLLSLLSTTTTYIIVITQLRQT